MVEYNRRKKEELKRLNEHITKQDNIVDHKPRPDTSTYVYAGSLSVLGLAIGGYLLYNKFKKPERKLIDVLAPPSTVSKKPERKLIDVPAPPSTVSTEPKRDIF